MIEDVRDEPGAVITRMTPRPYRWFETLRWLGAHLGLPLVGAGLVSLAWLSFAPPDAPSIGSPLWLYVTGMTLMMIWLAVWIGERLVRHPMAGVDTASFFTLNAQDKETPELADLAPAVRAIAAAFGCQQAALYELDVERGHLRAIQAEGVGAETIPLGDIELPTHWIARSDMAGPAPLLAQLPWAEIAVVLTASDRQPRGVLALGPFQGRYRFGDIETYELIRAARALGWAMHYVALLQSGPALARALITQQQRERRDISNKLHAGLGLVGTASGLLRLIAASPEGVEAHRAVAANYADALAQLRRDLSTLMFELHPEEINLDLFSLVRATVERTRNQFPDLPIVLESEAFGREIRYRDEIMSNIFDIVYEALTNAGRHAQASQLWVAIRYRDHRCEIVIEDDGQGLPGAVATAAGPGGRLRGGTGLRRMRALADEIPARLTVDPRPGGGTRVTLAV